MQTYEEFLARKMATPESIGLSDVNNLPSFLKSHQRDIVTWALKRGRAAIFAGTGLGKALDVSTPVLTPSGFKTISSVSVGDSVIGADGKATKVIGVFPQGIRPAFKVTFSDDSSVVCDHEHLWTVRTKKDKHRKRPWRTLTLREIMDAGIGDDGERSQRWFIPMVEPIELPEPELPLHPYILGCLIGDGSFRSNKIGFTTADPEIAEFINEHLPFGYGLVKREYSKYDYTINRIKDCEDGRRGGHWKNQISEIIESLGLANHLSPEKFIPDLYKFASSRSRLFLLQGLMDTDGSIWNAATTSSPVLEFSSSSERLARDVLFLVQSLGGRGKIHRRETACKPAYRLHPNFPHGVNPFMLSRKADLWKDREKYRPTRSIRKIESVSPREMICIKVANEDGLFVVNDCIVTHNTAMQLTWADVVQRETDRPVLVLAPLAVAQQTVQEAEKFSIDGVAYAAHQDDAKSRIVVTNYDRIQNFDPSDFSGIVLDESSIIKAHDSKTRATLIDFTKNIPFRLPCTATPAPNDYVELGNHAEFLGVCSAKEMLATWFVHDGSMKATNTKNHDARKNGKPVAEWRLKGHAESEFWEWLSSWSVMLRHPHELGYDEPCYDLPPLHKQFITVPSDLPVAHTLSERLRARRDSTEDRVRAAAKLVNSMPDRPWLVWCNSNAESEMLTAAIRDAVEVKGSDKPELKSQRLIGFANGTVRVLVSKPSIAGWGMNFQRCSHQVFVGLNDSFEQLFQAIRRCWRFGQTQDVYAWFIASTAEGAVVDNLAEKEAAAEHMAEQMSAHTRTLMTRTLKGEREVIPHTRTMEIPSWLT